MVVIGEIWFRRYDSDRMFAFFAAANVPIGLIGAVIGGTIYIRSIRKPRTNKKSPNQTPHPTPL
jgi:hypothetical protein